MSSAYITDQNKKFGNYTTVSNLIDELDLSPLAIALYLHFKRWAHSEHKKDISVRDLMKKYRCGSTAIKNAKTELVDNFLITIDDSQRHLGVADDIQIVDITNRNYEHFRKTVSPDSDATCHQIVTRPVTNQRHDLSPDSDALKEKGFKEKDLNKRHTHLLNVLDAPAPAQAGENGVCVDSKISSQTSAQNGHLSKYPLPTCERYIEFCQKRDGNIKSVEAVARTIHRNGLSDSEIADFLESEMHKPPEVKKAETEKSANCPRCYGTGIEYLFSESGEDLGCRVGCRHQLLVPGEWLWKWKNENDAG